MDSQLGKELSELREAMHSLQQEYEGEKRRHMDRVRELTDQLLRREIEVEN